MERIERLKPSQMLPDRFQPRRLLPVALRADFFSGKTDCYQAASEWLALSKVDAGYRGEIDRLLAMGGSFEEHGQIKPITGSWAPTSDGRFIFLIETGERRFWAACLLKVTSHAKEEPLLRVEVVEKPTRQRQVLENRHAELPSAVGQACEVAALILAELGIQPPANPVDEYDYFRQGRAQRMPAGLWDRITPIMQLTRPRMVQLLNILQLPTLLLELAVRYQLPERVLREVLALPHQQWEGVLRTAIKEKLTSDQVAEMTEGVHGSAEKSLAQRRPGRISDPSRSALNGLRRFANALGAVDEFSQAQALDEMADELVITRQAEGMMALLDELAGRVYTRLGETRPGRKGT